MKTSKFNPFRDLNKANDLIKCAIGTGIFGFNVLDNLLLISRVLDYMLSFERCFRSDYMSSPSVNDTEPVDLFLKEFENVHD